MSRSIHAVRNIGSKRKLVPAHFNGAKTQLQHDSVSDFIVNSEQTWNTIGRPIDFATEEQAVVSSGNSIKLLTDVWTAIRIFVAFLLYDVLGIETMDLFDLWSIPIHKGGKPSTSMYVQSYLGKAS